MVRTLDVIQRARENNVTIISLPSHNTHTMDMMALWQLTQSLNVNYNKLVQAWHREHQGRPVTEAEFGELFNGAYGVAATVKNATSGFRASGIFPFEPYIFCDEDFIASCATDRPDPAESTPVRLEVAEGCVSVPSEASEGSASTATVPSCPPSAPDPEESKSDHPLEPATFRQLLMKSSDSEKSRQRKRKSVQHAEIITQSPYKKKLEESIANAAKGLEQKESREKKGEKRRVAQAKVTVDNKSKLKKTKENATRKGTRKAKKPKQTKK